MTAKKPSSKMKMRSQSRALDKIYKRRDRYEIPDWQREEVWSDDRKRDLIDTILRGWKLPKFYFLKTQETPEEFEVVDGQQRITTIWSFFDDELVLSKEQAEEFGGDRYSTLPDNASDQFDDYEIEFDEMTNATDEEAKTFFQRLQQGVQLNSSEKLNSIHSKLRDYCVAASKKPFFQKTATASSKRYAYFDIVAKVATLEIEGLDAPLRYKDVKSVFESNQNFSTTSAAAKRINCALSYLHNSLPTSYKLLRNRTIIQSIITLVCHLESAGVKNLEDTDLADFIDWFLNELRAQVELGQNASDPDFIAFQRTVNANVRTAARDRQNILLRKLFQRYPDFFLDLSKSPSLSNAIEKDLQTVSKQIQETITLCNERHSAKHGKDLFKPTTKTVSALGSLGNPISSYEEYKNLIDALYFLFRESVGTRIDPSDYDSFRDVNTLRTALQHDVDHGKPGKVKKKKTEIGKTFKVYSGIESPTAVGAGNFKLVQANLLKALRSDLITISKNLV